MLFPRKILSFPLLRCADLFLVDISGKEIWCKDWTGCKHSTFTFAHNRKVHLSLLTPISSKRPCWCFGQGWRCCLILLDVRRTEEQSSSFCWRKECWVSQGRDRWAWGMNYNGSGWIWSNCLEGREHFIFRGPPCYEDGSLAASVWFKGTMALDCILAFIPSTIRSGFKMDPICSSCILTRLGRVWERWGLDLPWLSLGESMEGRCQSWEEKV